MALSEDEKTRIREEELLRLQTREEFRIMQGRHSGAKDHLNAVVFLILFAIAFGGMWFLVKSAKDKRSQRDLAPAASVRVTLGTCSATRA